MAALARAAAGALDAGADVTGQPFDKAIQATIKEAGQSAWEVQITSPTTTT